MEYNEMFKPPARKSMTDEQLQEALGAAKSDESGIMAAMELLEAQSTLREEDNREFELWAQATEAIGTPEALHAVENGRRLKAGLEPIEFAQPAAEPVAEPTVKHIAEPVVENVAEPIVESVVEPAPIQTSEASNFDDEIAQSLNALYAPSSSAPAAAPAPTPAADPEVVSEPIAEAQAQSPLDEFDQILSAEEVATAEQEELVELPLEVFDVEAPAPPTSSYVYDGAADLDVAVDPKRSSAAVSQLWPWLAIASGIFPVAIAFGLFQLKLTALQGTLALALGLALSAITFAVGAIAGKRSGLPTLLLSRSAFGVVGNLIPGWLVAVARFALPIALVAVAHATVTQQFGANSIALNFRSSGLWITAGTIAVLAVAATILALNYKFAKFANLWIGSVSVVVVIALAVGMASQFSFANLDFATSNQDLLNVLSAAAIIYALYGAVWASIGADYSRELAKKARGLQAAAWTLLGSFVAPLVLGIYFFFAFSGSTAGFKQKLAEGFLPAIANIGAPYLSPLAIFAAAAFFVLWMSASLSAVKLAVASLGLRGGSVVLVIAVAAVAVAGGTAFWAWLGNAELWAAVVDYAKLIAVPIAAWAGIFSADVLIRRIAYHEVSLSRAYGFYKSANFVNVFAWLIATVVSLGVASSIRPELAWLGFISKQASFGNNQELALASVFVAFGLAFLAPIAFGIPRIKRQEAEVLAIESRRDDLKDIFKFAE